MSSSSVELFKVAGDAAFKSKCYADAIVAYSKAIALDGSNHVLFSNRSGAYLAQGHPDASLQDAMMCIQLNPSFVKGYSRKGAALLQLKQYKLAVAAYHQGLFVAPSDASLQNGLLDAESASMATVEIADQQLDTTATIGHSATLVSHVIAFLHHREQIDELWASYSVDGLVEAIPQIDLIETIIPSSSSQKDRFDPAMRQMSLAAESVTGLNELYEAAECALHIYNNILLEDVASSIPDLNIEDVHTTGLKGRPRAAQKAQDDYSKRSSGPGEAWLFDIVRGSIECDTEQQIVAVVEAVRMHPSVQIIRLKNRFKNPTPPGFRDINMNIRIPIGAYEGKTIYHICELQVHHKEVKGFAKKNGSHHHYEYFREYFSGGVDALAVRMALFRDIGLFAREATASHSVDDAASASVETHDSHSEDHSSVCLERLVDLVVTTRDEQKLLGLHHLLKEISEVALEERVLRCLQEGATSRFDAFLFTNLLANNVQRQMKTEEAKGLAEKNIADVEHIVFEYESERNWCEMTAYNQLGLIYRDLSLFEDALVYMKRSWDLSKQLHHDHSLAAAQGHAYMGSVYLAVGNLLDAKVHLEENLKICVMQLGEESREVANASLELAKLYSLQSKYAAAKGLLEAALGVRRRINGETHMDTALAQSELGCCLQKLAKYEEAEPLLHKCYETTRTLLGENHADTAAALNNVAHIYCLQTRWDLALPLLLKGTEVSRRVLGEQHHLTATFHNNLGAALYGQGQYAEARSFFERSLSIRQAVLGEDHPQTGKASGDLGTALQMLGDLEGAGICLQRSVDVYRRQKGGLENLDVATTLNSLGSLLHKFNQLEEAEGALVEALQIYRVHLGEKDVTVAAAMNNLGLVYRDQCRSDEAIQCLQYSFQIYCMVAGQSHPNTMNIMGNLGTAMMRRTDEAQCREGRLLVTQAISYFRASGCGPEHPYIVKFEAALAA